MPKPRSLEIPMPEFNQFSSDEGSTATLSIDVRGYKGEISARAAVQHIHDDSMTMATIDYSEELERIRCRATQKPVDAMFAKWSDQETVDRIKAKAREHYKSDFVAELQQRLTNA